MNETLFDRELSDTTDERLPASEVAGAHESDGTLGRVAGTGSGAISGGIVGAVFGGPLGAVIGAVAGGALGAAVGEAAHHMGNDHDDVNAETGGGGGDLPGIPVHVTMPQDDDDTNYDGTSGLDNPDYDPGLPVESDDDARGTMERFADATGDTMDNDVGRVVLDSDGRPLTGDAADFALNDDRADDAPRVN